MLPCFLSQRIVSLLGESQSVQTTSDVVLLWDCDIWGAHSEKKQTQNHAFLPVPHTQGHGRNSARGEGECTTISEEKLKWPINVFPDAGLLPLSRRQGNSSSPHFMRDNKRALGVTTEKFFSALKPNVFTRGRGKNARVKLMKTSQNTALLWLIPPSWQVPKPRRRPRVWLSAPIELDFCVSCYELQACATHFLSILLKMIRSVLFIMRS